MSKLRGGLRLLWSLRRHENRKKFEALVGAFMRDVGQAETKDSSRVIEEDLKSLSTGHGLKVLLVIHEFSRTGAPYAVFYLAEALFAIRGVRPVVVSPKDGPIRDEFHAKGFTTAVVPSLFDCRTVSSQVIDFLTGFERVIVTSLACHGFVGRFRGLIKHLAWWIHETEVGFAAVNSMNAELPLLFASCDSVWLGSPLCFPLASQYVSSDKLHLLLYGCPDVASPHTCHTSEKVIFIIVGSVEHRKGQDIFLRAIQLLPEELRRKAKFRVIGSPLPSDKSIRYYRSLRAEAKQIPEIEFFENMPSVKLNEFYLDTHVVVSASRDDPMPIAITQGLMFSKVCLCSSAIGHSALLEHGKDGLIFTNQSENELSAKIAWLINNPEQFAAFGKCGRNVYESYFQMSSFVSCVEGLLDK